PSLSTSLQAKIGGEGIRTPVRILAPEESPFPRQWTSSNIPGSRRLLPVSLSDGPFDRNPAQSVWDTWRAFEGNKTRSIGSTVSQTQMGRACSAARRKPIERKRKNLRTDLRKRRMVEQLHDRPNEL